MGKVFDFLEATNEALRHRGVQLPVEGQSTTTPETRQAKGLELQKEIAGADRIDRMYASAPDDEPHFRRFLSANCFGDYVTRGSVDIRTRELLTFAMLVSLGGCDPQVRGDVAGNLNVGNNRGMLLSVLTQLLPFIGYPRTLNGLAAINDVVRAGQSS